MRAGCRAHVERHAQAVGWAHLLPHGLALGGVGAGWGMLME